ncbi:MAG: hypothetical protein ABSA42_19395 [Terracidiphilus sp.]|jgi:hypothetical protein
MFRQVLRFHFAIGFVIFALLGVQALAAQAGVASDGSQVLVVWTAGSPTTDEAPAANIPPNLERKAESMRLHLQVRAFRASEFTQEFLKAFAAHQEPDIIVVENIANIVNPASGQYAVHGMASNPGALQSLTLVYGSFVELEDPRGGREFLVSTSSHAQAARQFALRPPDCDTISVAPTPVPADIVQAAAPIANAYLSAPETLKAYDDPDRLTTEGVRFSPMNVRETRTCGSWGNDLLAFVSLLSTVDRTGAHDANSIVSITRGPLVGQMPALLVLRKQQDQWRLLAAAIDPVTNDPFLHQIPAISWFAQGPGREEPVVTPAQLLSPENGSAPAPNPHDRFGDFTWKPSSSRNVVAQIVEFAYQNDDRLFFSTVHNNIAQDRISAGLLWNTKSECKWRVWSISDTGSVAFSDYRTFHQ